MVNPIRTALKDLSQHFQSPRFSKVSADQLAQREEHLEKQYSLLVAMELVSEKTSFINDTMRRKMKEIVKEEKLQRERLSDLAQAVSKRYKDLATSGVFQ